MLLSDFVIDFLVKNGLKDIFLVSGGGIMYLLDSIARNKKINYISNYHEQASAISAEGYSRVTAKPGVCLVTTGPGSTNAVTGVAGAWVESIPMVVISGQVKRETIADYTKLRQLGVQEINIIDIVKKITKYSKEVIDPNLIAYELERAFFEATDGRPGPVWLSIPLDVQNTVINEKNLKHFKPLSVKQKNASLIKQVKETVELMKKSRRPLLAVGFGIRLAQGEKLLYKLMDKLRIPVVHNINSVDLVNEDHPLNIGLFGPHGHRRANFAVQNCDFLLTIGSGLDINETGFNFKDFARKAKKIGINIDKAELEKANVMLDLPIVADAGEFMGSLLKEIKGEKFNFSKKWFEVCLYWKDKYPTIIKEYFRDKEHVNSYVFMDVLSDITNPTDVLTTGIGQDVVAFYQAFKIKKGQRAFANKHFGGMGWCLPLTIGACVGNKKSRTVCVTGDGSIQFNIQELNTIDYYRLPIKIFVFSNKGYKSIRDTQNNLFEGRLVGADETSGVQNPNFKKISEGYNLKYGYIKNNEELKKKISEALEFKGPTLYEVNIAFDQPRIPKSVTYRNKDGQLKSRPLEDLWPLLSREE